LPRLRDASRDLPDLTAAGELSVSLPALYLNPHELSSMFPSGASLDFLLFADIFLLAENSRGGIRNSHGG
jgi:hypothetical protein